MYIYNNKLTSKQTNEEWVLFIIFQIYYLQRLACITKSSNNNYSSQQDRVAFVLSCSYSYYDVAWLDKCSFSAMQCVLSVEVKVSALLLSESSTLHTSRIGFYLPSSVCLSCLLLLSFLQAQGGQVVFGSPSLSKYELFQLLTITSA